MDKRLYINDNKIDKQHEELLNLVNYYKEVMISHIEEIDSKINDYR